MVTRAASAQQTANTPLSGSPAIAFVNVNLIRMDRERVESGQTVVVQGDRVAAVGAAGDVRLTPALAAECHEALAFVGRGPGHALRRAHGRAAGQVQAQAQDGRVPADAHRGRAELGPALIADVRDVLDLQPRPIEWRQRIESGDLLGPTIYTSGPFVNEPRVTTPEEVRRDVSMQARQGYDLIKFHEVPGTTTGLSLAAYRTMNETAREVGIPLVGHAPVNLGLDVLLHEHQALAHMGMLGNMYFLPLQSNVRFVAVTATAIVLLTLVVFTWGGAAMVAWLRKAAARSGR